ncbi:hypothetical protein FBU30_003152 [Linnemannia zychae]|nr:hypothetical protein FBU30_003152 [Linnemannia zychae]
MSYLSPLSNTPFSEDDTILYRSSALSTEASSPALYAHGIDINKYNRSIHDNKKINPSVIFNGIFQQQPLIVPPRRSSIAPATKGFGTVAIEVAAEGNSRSTATLHCGSLSPPSSMPRDKGKFRTTSVTVTFTNFLREDNSSINSNDSHFVDQHDKVKKLENVNISGNRNNSEATKDNSKKKGKPSDYVTNTTTKTRTSTPIIMPDYCAMWMDLVSVPHPSTKPKQKEDLKQKTKKTENSTSFMRNQRRRSVASTTAMDTIKAGKLIFSTLASTFKKHSRVTHLRQAGQKQLQHALDSTTSPLQQNYIAAQSQTKASNHLAKDTSQLNVLPTFLCSTEYTQPVNASLFASQPNLAMVTTATSSFPLTTMTKSASIAEKKNELAPKIGDTFAIGNDTRLTQAQVEDNMILSSMGWPNLPKTVTITDLPEYIPDDSFGRNARRNERYARARLIALRDHQHVLIMLLSQLSSMERYHHLRCDHVIVPIALRTRLHSDGEISLPVASTFNSSKATTELEYEFSCQKRLRCQLEKRNATIQAYRRVILEIWQMDQSLCYWLSRYIRATRYIDQSLNFMLSTLMDNPNSASIASLKPPDYDLDFDDENSHHAFRVDPDEQPISSVSNPELERMGILQSRLLDYSTGAFSTKENEIITQDIRKIDPCLGLESNEPSDSAKAFFGLTASSTTAIMPSLAIPVPPFVQETSSSPLILNQINSSFTLPPQSSPELSKVNNDIASGASMDSFLSKFDGNFSTSGFTSITTTTTGSIPYTFSTKISILPAPQLNQDMPELATSSVPIASRPDISAPKFPKVVNTPFFPTVLPISDSPLLSSRTSPVSVPLVSSTAGSYSIVVDKDSSILRSQLSSSIAPILEHHQNNHQIHDKCSLHNSMSSIFKPTTYDHETIGIGIEAGIDNKHVCQNISSTPTIASTSTSITDTLSTITAIVISEAETETGETKSNTAICEYDLVSCYYDSHEIESSVYIGYHLQACAKANEFLLQFNKESCRAAAILERFEAAQQAFIQVMGFDKKIK